MRERRQRAPDGYGAFPGRMPSNISGHRTNEASEQADTAVRQEKGHIYVMRDAVGESQAGRVAAGDADCAREKKSRARS